MSSVEKVFELRITSLDLPLVGVIDLVAALDGKRTVIDFKTTASAFEGWSLHLGGYRAPLKELARHAEQAVQ